MIEIVYLNHLNFSFRLIVDSRSLGNPSSIGNSLDYSSFDPELEMAIDYLVENMLIGKLAAENTSTLFKMGHQFEDFVFNCNFKGSDCR